MAEDPVHVTCTRGRRERLRNVRGRTPWRDENSGVGSRIRIKSTMAVRDAFARLKPHCFVSRRAGIAWLSALALLASCAAPPTGERSAPKAVFYPAAPEPPRIQYLTSFATERDLKGLDSGFARFIAGEDKSAVRLVLPYGVVAFEGKIYVIDTRRAEMLAFDLAKRTLSSFPGSGGGRMKRPINLTIDRDGTKYVTDTGRDQILVFDRDDRFVRALGSPEQFRPVDVAIAGDRLYVVDIKNHQVHVLDKRTGRLLHKFGQAGSGPGELFQPTNIAIGPDGDLYVVETGNFRVQRFKPDGTVARSYGTIGNTPGTFARPKGIAVDRAGRLYVSDAAFQNVQIFSNDGRVLMAFGQPEGDFSGLSLPAAVSIDYDHVAAFRRYADPRFDLECVVLVASQVTPSRIDVFGLGRMQGMPYPPEAPPLPAPSTR
ncbi:MAG: 6-bladed beta-propeller [Pseudomonadota bacterium]